MERAFMLAYETLVSLWESFLKSIPLIGAGIVVFLIFLLLAGIAKRILITLGERTELDRILLRVLAGIAWVAVAILGGLIAAVIIFPDFSLGNLVAGLGITSVAVGFAFKDILQNFVAGMLILWRRPFQIGDLIQTCNYKGRVVDIDIRTVHLLTLDGVKIILPTGQVYSNPTEIFTASGKRRQEFIVGIGCDEPIEKSVKIIVNTLKNLEGVMKDPEPEALASELAAYTVNLKVRFWVDGKANMPKHLDRAITAVKSALDRAGVDMPQPQQTVQLHRSPPQAMQPESATKSQGADKASLAGEESRQLTSK